LPNDSSVTNTHGEEINPLLNGTADVNKDVLGTLIVTRGTETLLRAHN
jgi:hypothetical protein